jgi:hypothetical protein
MSVKLSATELRALGQSLAGPVAKDILMRSNKVRNKALRLAPVDQGRLRQSITVEVRAEGGTIVGRVGTNVKYAMWVHEGTGIYAGRGYITPKSAKALRWPVKNQSGQGRRRFRAGKTANYAYAKRVKGMKGRPFLRDALDAAGGRSRIVL